MLLSVFSYISGHVAACDLAVYNLSPVTSCPGFVIARFLQALFVGAMMSTFLMFLASCSVLIVVATVRVFPAPGTPRSRVSHCVATLVAASVCSLLRDLGNSGASRFFL